MTLPSIKRSKSSIALYTVVFDQESHASEEGSCVTGWLFSQEDLHRVVCGTTLEGILTVYCSTTIRI